jgi:DNA-binding transcriptional regulator LsrR (DeoR family)
MIYTELSDHQKEVLAVAYLSAQNYKAAQAIEILKQYGIEIESVSTFGRRLKEAEDMGWLLHVVPEERFSPEVMAEIREITCPRELVDRLKGLSSGLRNVSVFYSGSLGTAPEDWDYRLKYHSPFAARRILRLLEQAQARNVGVSWGHQVAAIASAMVSTSSKRPMPLMRFIPTSGEPLQAPTRWPERTSTGVVAQLHRRFGDHERERALSLAGVAAVLSDAHDEIIKEAILRYIGSINDFKRIFLGIGAEAALIHQIDTMLASVASIGQGLTMFHAELAQIGGIPRERLAELVEGDVAGVLIKKSKLTAAQEQEFESIRKSWTGIRQEHLLDIATRARATGKPGVVVVAIGKNKADILRTVLRMDLVNELIIDHDLAEALN